jgi:predicted DNA-binding transcriptional regulator AlpA
MRRRQQNRRKALRKEVAQSRLYSVADLARYFRVGISTIHDWKKRGLLPEPLKNWGHKRWDLSEVNAWMKKQDPDGW